MRFDVLTIFPSIFPGPLGVGVVGRALERGELELHTHDLRDFTTDRHRQVDGEPFGGGAGMVLKAQPIISAVRRLRREVPGLRSILLSPQGRPLDQELVRELASGPPLLLVCGRYQGVDDRARAEIGEELSIGDYLLSGGETAAMVVIEAVARLVPGVVGCQESLRQETFAAGGFEAPLYTRPARVEGSEVPEVLLSGDHAAIERWRQEEGARRARSRRPDLLRSRTGPGGAE